MAAGDLTSTPLVKLRMLNHWDNLDGTVERGYAGQSLWDWWTLPDFKDQRYNDYARANAAIAVAQYAPSVAARLADPATTPERNLLWFHHLSWDRLMASGRALWKERVVHYDRVAKSREHAADMGHVEAQGGCRTLGKNGDLTGRPGTRGALVARCEPRLSDVGQPATAPAGAAAPALACYKAQHFPYAPGHTP